MFISSAASLKQPYSFGTEHKVIIQNGMAEDTEWLHFNLRPYS